MKSPFLCILMNRFPYPKILLHNRLKRTAIETGFLLLFSYLESIHDRKDGPEMLMLLLLGVNLSISLYSCAKLKYGCIAQIDGDNLRIYSKSIPIANIAAIERQIISGKQYGINMKMRDNRIRSFQFPELQDAQIDDLVVFLSDTVNVMTC